ncbi:MAG: hypothetical protein OXR68_07905 [Alphaproteobacteria bacterium]|nr:hypothetical protein [Alphaproteobacteria bacterium]MDD9920528.1 hypothetical protein [Alphaproteobacteria bacterium]
MELLTYVVIGLITGFITGKLLKTTHGIPSDVIIGILGAYVGGTMPGVLGVTVSGPFVPLLLPVLGGFIMLWVLHTLKK